MLRFMFCTLAITVCLCGYLKLIECEFLAVRHVASYYANKIKIVSLHPKIIQNLQEVTNGGKMEL
jgi:hypothetical protein